MRKEKAHFIQRFVHINMPVQRRADHAPQQLGDIGSVLGMTEGHHGFRPRAVPACGEVLLKEHNADFPVLRYIRSLHMVYLQPVGFHRGSLPEGVDHLIFGKTGASPCFNAGKAFPDFRCGSTVAVTVLHLDYQHGTYLLRMLRFTVVIPVFAFVFPLIGRSLQDHHVINGILFRVRDDDPVLQQA